MQSSTLERDTEEEVEAPAAAPAPAEADVCLTVAEKDAVVRTSAAEATKDRVEAQDQRVGEPRAWSDRNERVSVD